MDRREAISRISWILGGTIVGSSIFLETGCRTSTKDAADFFNAEIIAKLDEMGETILPRTSTPGAKDAKIGEFMAVMVTDCYTKEDQKVFRDGVEELQDRFKKEQGKEFMDATSQERTAFFVKLDKEQQDYMNAKKAEEPSHYFRMIKELTLLGFFTSEVGATKAMRYIESPGRYDGDVPYKKGDKAWANS